MKALVSLWLTGFVFVIGCPQFRAATPLDGWAERYVAADGLNGVAYGAGLFVGVGQAAYTSPDGVWWTRRPVNVTFDNSLGGVAYGNGRFIAVEPYTSTRTNSAHLSTNGIFWQRVADLGSQPAVIYQVAFCGGTFLALGYISNPAPATGYHWLIMDSTNGINWGTHSGPVIDGESQFLGSAAFGNGSYVVVGGGWGPNNVALNLTLVSTDLVNWTNASGFRGSGITFGQGKFVAVGDDKIATSHDGIQWTTQLSGLTGNLAAVTFAADTFVAAGATHLLLSSTNAVDWTQYPVATDGLAAVTYGNNTFVAGGGYYTDVPRAMAVVSGGNTQPSLQAVGFVSSPKPGFQLLLSAQRGNTYRLQASPSLPATSWADVLSVNLQPGFPGPPIQLTDTNATRTGQRFYRVVSP